MVLEYKFEYLSSDDSYSNLLDNILKERDLEYTIFRQGDYIYLYIQDEEEALLKISEELSFKLPMSIFLKNYALEVVEKLPQRKKEILKNVRSLPYCSSCMANIENSDINGFTCDICGSFSDKDSLKFYEKDVLSSSKIDSSFFEDIARKIKDGKKLRLKTKYFDYVLSSFDRLKKNKEKLIFTDIEAISKIVVSSNEKKVLLLSMEKPSILFNVNEIYKKNNDINFDKVFLSSPKDLIALFLSKHLRNLGIEFLRYEKSQDYDYMLEEISQDSIDGDFEIAINEDKIFVLNNPFYDLKLYEIYKKFDEKAKAQFMVLLHENSLLEKSILNIYCSSKNEEQITFYSPKIDGMIDVLKYNMPKNVKEIFSKIEASDTGKRLLENYKLKFPKEYEKAINSENFDFENSGIMALWDIVKLVLGFDLSVLENAKKALLQKGPRLDYKLIKSDKFYNREFNIAKFIQSGMSFKLAGVEERVLALGYVESYAYFLANIVDEINKEFELDGVSLCGDLIADETFYKMIKKAISKNFKLFYNKDFPIQL